MGAVLLMLSYSFLFFWIHVFGFCIASPVSVASDTSLPILWRGLSLLLISWLQHITGGHLCSPRALTPPRPVGTFHTISFSHVSASNIAGETEHRAPKHVTLSCFLLVDNEGLIWGLQDFEHLTRKPSTFHIHGHQQTQTDKRSQ